MQVENHVEGRSARASLEQKQTQFNDAMARYDQKRVYKLLGRLVSLANISLQVFLFYLVLPMSIGIPGQIVAFIVAFLLADFVNGLVHMLMDNNDNYISPAGPLVANFHLHHRTPRYKIHSIPVVYFNETGSKIWLVAFLGAGTALIAAGIHPILAYAILYFGLLSSVAEVSHYLCHVPETRGGNLLGNTGLLLSKRHHGRHHIEDNVNYAFLNGVTDPLLNLMARRWVPGYKATTDRHYECYVGPGSPNRNTNQTYPGLP